MTRKGTYALFLLFRRGASVRVGSLGALRVLPGEYCYVGSAMGGLDRRVSRHLSKRKAMRWHIDPLTLAADSLEAYESYPDPVPECRLAELAERCGGVPAFPGFGCSDCRCATHLLLMPPGAKASFIASAGLSSFAPAESQPDVPRPPSG